MGVENISEFTANQEWGEAVEGQNLEELESEIGSKFFDSSILERELQYFENNDEFQDRRQEILEQVNEKLQNKKLPEEDDPYTEQEKWDEALAETVKGIIEKNLHQKAA